MGLLDHVAKPAEHHPGQDQYACQQDQMTAFAVADHHGAATEYGDEHADRSDYGPFALRRYVIGFVRFVCLMTRHLLFSLSGSQIQLLCTAATSGPAMRSVISNKV